MRCALLILLSLVGLHCQAASVGLGWDPEAGADGFRVYFGPGSRNYTNSIDAGNKLTARVNGLLPAGQYYFAATAYTADGLESDFSNEVAYRVPLQAPLLARPETQIFVTTFVLEESTNMVTWSQVDAQPVFFTQPFDPSASGHFYRVQQLNAGAPIKISLTL